MLFDKYLSHITGTKRKILTNVLWSISGKVVMLMGALIVNVLVARYLGPDQFGTMNYIISVVALFSIFATFGMPDIVIRELSKKDLSPNIILGTSFRLRMCLALLTIFFVIVYASIFEERDITCMMIVYSIFMIFSSFDVMRNYFTSILENKRIVISEVFRTIILSFVKLALVFLHAPLIFFVISLMLDYVFLAMGYFTNYQRIADWRQWSYNAVLARHLLKNSLPLLLAGATMIVYQRIDQVLIAHLIDMTSVGYFSTALSFVNVVGFVPTIMVQTVTPILVEYKKNNPMKYETESQRVMNIIVWFTVVMCIVVSLMSYPLIRYSYGVKYLASVPILQVLVFKAVGLAVTIMGGSLVVIENIHKYAFIRNLLACIICIITNYIFIPIWGVMGSAWATVITLLFTGFLGNLFIPSYHHIHRKQIKCLLFGWRDLKNIKLLIKSV